MPLIYFTYRYGPCSRSGAPVDTDVPVATTAGKLSMHLIIKKTIKEVVKKQTISMFATEQTIVGTG